MLLGIADPQTVQMEAEEGAESTRNLEVLEARRLVCLRSDSRSVAELPFNPMAVWGNYLIAIAVVIVIIIIVIVSHPPTRWQTPFWQPAAVILYHTYPELRARRFDWMKPSRVIM